MGTVFECLLNPPPWMAMPTIALGLALIYWDAKKRQAQPGLTATRPKSGSTEAPAKNEPEQPASNQQIAVAASQLSKALRTINAFDNIRTAHDVKAPECIRLLGQGLQSSDPVEKERIQNRIAHLRAMRPELLEAHFNRRLAEFKAK